MRTQGLDRVETACQFGLGQGGVHLFVTDLMQQNGRSALASFEFWDQMMQAATETQGRSGAAPSKMTTNQDFCVQ